MTQARWLGLGALALGMGAPLAAQTEMARPVVAAEETILRVQGVGRIAAAPEVMTITVGVVTTGESAAAALDANNRKLAPVIAVLRDAGIPPEQIQTSGLSVDPQFADTRNATVDRILGFRASGAVTVESRDLASAGDLVSALFDAGANSISGPEFAVAEENVERLTRSAEAEALREARAQADATASALGMRVARVLLVSDSQVQMSKGNGAIVVTGSRIARTPIEPGEITLEARYSLEFALEPLPAR
ncbi:MAG: SIMPL domain-containing protein [Alphaproteobacteria bacterium]|nr:SIMPL domain-containing protein [Alphaproteobacteria bacterium]